MPKPGKTKENPGANGLFAQTEGLFAQPLHEPSRGPRIQINQKVLRAELDLLSEVVETKKSALPLNHVLIETAGNRVMLKAAGPINTLRCEAEANVLGAGSLCLPAIRFYEIVKQLPSGMIDLSGDGNNAVIKAGGSRIKINGMLPDLFPELPTCEKFVVTIPSEVVSILIHSTFFAAYKDDDSGRYALNGARLTIGPTGIRMLATDGHRLSCVQREEVKSDKAVDLVIPRDGLSAAAKLISHDKGEAKISVDGNRIFFDVGTRKLSCLLLDKGYPDCEPTLSKSYQHQLTFDAIVFNDAVNRMAVFGADGTLSQPGKIKLRFASSAYEMLGVDHNGGESREEISPLSTERGGDLAISFNGRYLRDFARTLSGSSLTIKYNDGESQAEFCLADDEGHVIRYTLMPIRA